MAWAQILRLLRAKKMIPPPAMVSCPPPPGKLARVSWTSKALLTQTAALLGMALVTFGLFAWGSAEVWAQRADRVATAAWSIRCLGAAAIGAGQVVFAVIVLPAFTSRGPHARSAFEHAVALAMGLLAMLSLVAGAALAAAAGW